MTQRPPHTFAAMSGTRPLRAVASAVPARHSDTPATHPVASACWNGASAFRDPSHHVTCTKFRHPQRANVVPRHTPHAT
ncbi:exported hypothetical protein [Streptomyces misionensis JCM 4497]